VQEGPLQQREASTLLMVMREMALEDVGCAINSEGDGSFGITPIQQALVFWRRVSRAAGIHVGFYSPALFSGAYFRKRKPSYPFTLILKRPQLSLQFIDDSSFIAKQNISPFQKSADKSVWPLAAKRDGNLA